jgi:hypothetical protein
MLYFNRKLAAVFLAIWLPLFSGNALAVSIAMQSTSGDCHPAQLSRYHTQHADTTMHQHMQHAGHHLQQSLQHDQQNVQQSPSHNDCGVCQLACCGYMATVAIDVAEIKPPAQQFALSSTQFQSFNSAPLVPPPLDRA